MNEEKRKLTFWQSVENFWYYYKWRVFFVILLIVTVYLSVQLFKDNTKELPRDMTVVSVFAHPLTAEDYDIDKRLEKIVADVNSDGSKDVVLSQYYITESRSTDNDLVSLEQFEAHLKNAKGDLLLFDEVNLAFYLSKDIFEPIDSYVDLSGIPAENIITKNGVPVAVKLEKSKTLSEMGFIIDKVYASVMFLPDGADDTVIKTRENTKHAILKLLEQ